MTVTAEPLSAARWPVPRPGCVCPPSYVRDVCHEHTSADRPLNPHGEALRAEQAAAAESPAPSCATLDLEREADGMGFVPLMRLTAQLLQERSMSADSARALAGMLVEWRRGSLNSSDVRRAEHRCLELSAYARQLDTAAACCERCGQTMIAGGRCVPCDEQDRQPTEQAGLFDTTAYEATRPRRATAHAPIAGQEGMF